MSDLQPNVSEYRKAFKKSKPFRHIVIRNVIKTEALNKLRLAALEETYTPFNSDLFQFSQTGNLLTSSNATIGLFCMDLKSSAMIEFVKKITHEKLSGEIDISAYMYQKTDYLLPHDDLIDEKNSSRRIAFILYLSSLTKSDGGSLDLFNSKGNIEKSFYPDAGSLVLLQVSNVSYHQVAEVITHKQRLTIAGWFHG